MTARRRSNPRDVGFAVAKGSSGSPVGRGAFRKKGVVKISDHAASPVCLVVFFRVRGSARDYSEARVDGPDLEDDADFSTSKKAQRLSNGSRSPKNSEKARGI